MPIATGSRLNSWAWFNAAGDTYGVSMTFDANGKFNLKTNIANASTAPANFVILGY